MSELMGKETKQNSSKSDKKNINHIDNSIESQTDGPGSILEIKDLCFAYPEEEKRALNHISFQIKEGKEPEKHMCTTIGWINNSERIPDSPVSCLILQIFYYSPHRCKECKKYNASNDQKIDL